MGDFNHGRLLYIKRYIFIIKVKGEQNRKIRCRKKFHKRRYKDMRKYLAKIDRNNTMENKTATECWNILKSEIDCIVETISPLKNRGNGIKTLIERSH